MSDEITSLLRQAVEASCCCSCGCFQDAVSALSASELAGALAPVLADAEATFLPREQDCLGCEVCWPADAINAAARRGVDVAAEPCCCAVEQREGWPPLPGDYRVARHAAPVAVCTLHSAGLGEALHRRGPRGLSIVGALRTENLGIERLVANVVANPHIRRLVLCGADTDRTVGHFPGQSLAALVERGVDGARRIIGARGRRPVLRNLAPAAVARFRAQIELVDRVGARDADALAALVEQEAARAPGPLEGEPPAPRGGVEIVSGRAPGPVTLDPGGYLVIHLDRRRQLLVAEHYRSTGELDLVVEGDNGVQVMTTLLDRELITRLDHAAYLGRELALAERALREGTAYVQGRAPERGA